jgi:hypothetical protein
MCRTRLWNVSNRYCIPYRYEILILICFLFRRFGGVMRHRPIHHRGEHFDIHGHCNVTQRYSENPKLGTWVNTQRKQYSLRQEEKKSQMTIRRIKALEGLDFAWNINEARWKQSLNELADYKYIHGHCNVPRSYSENSQLVWWVVNQRQQYRLYQEEKKSQMTIPRIKALKGLGFEWNRRRKSV